MSKPKPDERSEDFKATTDSIADAAERVADLEEAKAKLGPDDPAAHALSVEVEALIEGMDRDSATQRELTEGGNEGRPN